MNSYLNVFVEWGLGKVNRLVEGVNLTNVIRRVKLTGQVLFSLLLDFGRY